MIGRLRGIILEKQPPEILLEVNGVGYEIAMPMTCFYELADKGQEAIVYTQFIVREDAQLLYGFNNKQERALFRALIKVNGVGPKLALAILSGMSAGQFISAVEQSEIKTLVKLPGVGTKTAERLIVEMRDRLKRLGSELSLETSTLSEPSHSRSNNEIENEAVAALVALGYKPQEASRLVVKVMRPDIDSETLIKEALKAAL